MEDMKGLKSLDYTSPREAIAEKFHMSEALLEALNPGKKFDQAGQTISVVNVAKKDQPEPAVARLEVDKTAQTVKALGKTGELIAFFPASVGSDEKPTPSGVLKVTSIDARPNYRYNPGLQVQGCQIQGGVYDQARPQQSCRFALDRAFLGELRHSRHAVPRESQQIGIAWLCSPHQLGCRPAGEAVEEGHRGRLFEREAASKK